MNMELPLIYLPQLDASQDSIVIEGEALNHIKALRLRLHDAIHATNGKGLKAELVLREQGKRNMVFHCQSIQQLPDPQFPLHMAVAATKQAARNEWLLEKLVELGVQHIYFINTKRTVKEHHRFERLQSIMVAAMLQSQKCHLPELHLHIDLQQLLDNSTKFEQKYIAHCQQPKAAFHEQTLKSMPTLILIGPEGDFTPEEIAQAEAQGFKSIQLGQQRLRTETAAIAASAFFNLSL